MRSLKDYNTGEDTVSKYQVKKEREWDTRYWQPMYIPVCILNQLLDAMEYISTAACNSCNLG